MFQRIIVPSTPVSNMCFIERYNSSYKFISEGHDTELKHEQNSFQKYKYSHSISQAKLWSHQKLT